FKKSIGMILFFLLFSSAKAGNNNIILDSANAAYAKGNFDKAIKLYTSIVDQNIESPELYFNLGNAYYKTNNVGLAVLNYERARKLAPGDEDILTNLKLANQRIEDKIESAPQLFLTEWKNGIIDLMSERSWSYLCIFSLCITLVLIAIFILSANTAYKKSGFFGGTAVGILTIVLFFIAQQKYNHTIKSDEAIITSASVTVTGSPNEKGTKLFILHAGTKVVVTEEGDEWTEVKIANGNVGWVKTTTITTI
ncbi:MAG: tetratricopeptide repeat protein, partial [Bacteroidia bacterium]